MASLLDPDSSPVLAVGSSVDRPGTEAASPRSRTGRSRSSATNDKLFLIGSVLARRRWSWRSSRAWSTRSRFAFGAAMLVRARSSWPVPPSSTAPPFEAVDLVPAVLTALAGVAALWWLHRTAEGLPLDPRARSTVEVAKAEAAAGTHAPDGTDGDEVVISPGAGAHAAQPRPSRRGVLIAGGMLTAAAAVLGGAGRLDPAACAPGRGHHPARARRREPAPPLPEASTRPTRASRRCSISNDDFYRVDTRLDMPVVASDGWTPHHRRRRRERVRDQLRRAARDADGRARHHADLRLQQRRRQVRRRRPLARRTAQGPSSTGPAAAAGVDQLVATDFDGMTIGTPLDLVIDGREAILAVGMNGEPLPREHGFPARIIVPGLYGFISATKWVTRLTLTTYADAEVYWTERKWATDAPIKPSRAHRHPQAPHAGRRRQVLIGGVAWAQNDGGVAKVQVQIDGGPVAATPRLGPDVSNVYWRQWYQPRSTSRPGQHTSPPAWSTATARCRPTCAPSRSPAAPAASSASSSTSPEPTPLPSPRIQTHPPRPQHRTHHVQFPNGRHHLMKLQTLRRGTAAAAVLTLSFGPRRLWPTTSDSDDSDTSSAATGVLRAEPPPRTSPPRPTAEPAPRPSATAAPTVPDRRRPAPSTAWSTTRSPPPPATTRCSAPWSPRSAPPSRSTP